MNETWIYDEFITIANKCCHDPKKFVIVLEEFQSTINSPFYSCVLGCQAFEQEWAKGDLVMLQTLLLLKGKLICYHAN